MHASLHAVNVTFHSPARHITIPAKPKDAQTIAQHFVWMARDHDAKHNIKAVGICDSAGEVVDGPWFWDMRIEFE